jgi:hypothetical protein
MWKMKAVVLVAVGVVFARVDLARAQAAKPPTTQPVSRQAELERAFEQTLSNAVLVGHYTAGKNDKGDKEDRYTISKVTKLAGEMWLFMVRIEYGGKDVTVPIPLPVKWAGDTPVITVSDVNFPGLGTYTARVMFFHDQYAGTWSGGTHGGHLWGRIEHPKPATAAPAQAPAKNQDGK